MTSLPKIILQTFSKKLFENTQSVTKVVFGNFIIFVQTKPIIVFLFSF